MVCGYALIKFYSTQLLGWQGHQSLLPPRSIVLLGVREPGSKTSVLLERLDDFLDHGLALLRELRWWGETPVDGGRELEQQAHRVGVSGSRVWALLCRAMPMYSVGV